MKLVEHRKESSEVRTAPFESYIEKRLSQLAYISVQVVYDRCYFDALFEINCFSCHNDTLFLSLILYSESSQVRRGQGFFQGLHKVIIHFLMLFFLLIKFILIIVRHMFFLSSKRFFHRFTIKHLRNIYEISKHECILAETATIGTSH